MRLYVEMKKKKLHIFLEFSVFYMISFFTNVGNVEINTTLLLLRKL